jgi:hypothetical protein
MAQNRSAPAGWTSDSRRRQRTQRPYSPFPPCLIFAAAFIAVITVITVITTPTLSTMAVGVPQRLSVVQKPPLVRSMTATWLATPERGHESLVVRAPGWPDHRNPLRPCAATESMLEPAKWNPACHRDIARAPHLQYCGHLHLGTGRRATPMRRRDTEEIGNEVAFVRFCGSRRNCVWAV